MFVKDPNDNHDGGVPIAMIGVVPIPVTIDGAEDDNNENNTYYTDAPILTEATALLPEARAEIVKEPSSADSTPFRDLPWAILFLIHLSVMLWLAIDFGTFTVDKMDLNVTNWRNYIDDDASRPSDDQWMEFEIFVTEAEEWANVYPERILSYVILPAALVAYAVSYIVTALVIPSCPTAMVMICLLGTFAWAFALVLFVWVASHFNLVILVVGGCILGAVCYYLSRVWRLIPFAAVNLGMSLKGVSANCGIYVVAMLFSVAGFVWTIFWLYTLTGVMQALDRSYEENHPRPEGVSEKEYTREEQSHPSHGLVFFAMLLSLYWTTKILSNAVQVTVAGVMATWCYVEQEAQSCCSPGVYSSLYRSLTYSFGSICMGSLLEAFVTALRVMIQSARNQSNERDDGGFGAVLLCLLECIAKCLEDVLEYFNQWAWVYVGVYGYSYLEGGRKVVELFKARGFTSFVTNGLVGYVLGFTNFSVGILTGAISILIQSQVDKSHRDDDPTSSFVYGAATPPYVISMFVGFFVGIAVSSVMMNVVRGAVNTLIVCFADNPSKLEDNHPELTQRMAQAWAVAFPDAGLNSRPQYSVVV